MSDGLPGDQVDLDISREAFTAAIIKLADDEAFRASFLTHYRLWLHPPIMLTGELPPHFDLGPGAINFVSQDEWARPMSSLP